MARSEQDPAASTQQFRAFASRGESARRPGLSPALIAASAAGVVLMVALVAFFVV